MSVLVARDIEKVFREKDVTTTVLRGVSIEVEEGGFVALVGPSGSGKSTFLSIAGTLLSPTSGELEIAGESVLEREDVELTGFRNRHLGFVFQFHHLLPDFTALENVLFPIYGDDARDPAASEARARDLLDRVGLADRVDFRATALSGGQKQRVAVARAVMMKPDIVFADEPTGNLDRESSDEVMELLRALSRDEGTAFLISTHDEQIARRCDRIVTMEDGRIR